MNRWRGEDTWPLWGRKPSPSPSTAPATCQPQGRAGCRGRTSLCEYPASAKGDTGDRGDTTKGFSSCHPVINSLQASRRGKTSLATTYRSITSMGCSVWGEELGLLAEMGDGGWDIGKKAFLILKV